MCIRINMLSSNQLQLQVFSWRLCLLHPAACARVRLGTHRCGAGEYICEAGLSRDPAENLFGSACG